MLVKVNYLDANVFTVNLDDEAKFKLREIGLKTKVFFTSGVLRTAIIKGIDVLCEECKLFFNESEVQSGVGKKASSVEDEQVS